MYEQLDQRISYAFKLETETCFFVLFFCCSAIHLRLLLGLGLTVLPEIEL